MTLYADASTLLKRYVDERDSDQAVALVNSDPVIVTGRHTLIEVRRNLARLLDGEAATTAARAFAADVTRLAIIELDAETCERAATIAEVTGVKTLDALHLGAAQRLAGPGFALVTFDLRQAQAARALGLTVLGV